MSNEIIINNHSLQVKQYNGQNVVTFKDIDLCHNRPDGTARKRFNDNKKHFVKDVDFYKISPSDFRTAFGEGSMDKRQNNDITLITESGYLMLVKSFTDELSWNVQRMLVDSYFNYKETPYEYLEKTYNGEPVLTLVDIQQMTGIKRATANAYFKKYGDVSKDYFSLTSSEVIAFKKQNPKIGKSFSNIIVITKRGFTNFCAFYGITAELPKGFEEKPKLPQFAYNTNEVIDNLSSIKSKLTAMSAVVDELLNIQNTKNTDLAKYNLPLSTSLLYMAANVTCEVGIIKNSFK